MLSLEIDSACDNIWPNLLCRLSQELEVLDIKGVNAAVGDITLDTELPKLKELCLGFWSEGRGQEPIDHGRIFLVAGKTVEVLKLSGNGVAEDKVSEILRSLRNRLPMLHTISTRGLDQHVLEFADLLTHYGSQIRRVNFNEIKEHAEV